MLEQVCLHGLSSRHGHVSLDVAPSLGSVGASGGGACSFNQDIVLCLQQGWHLHLGTEHAQAGNHNTQALHSVPSQPC